MRTLLLESSSGAGAGAAAALSAAGHQVTRCHEPDAPPFPCVELSSPGSCPLHGSTAADVALVVRAPSDTLPTAGESGIGCAIRAGIPVVMLAGSSSNPFEGWTVPVEVDDPVAACEAALRAGQDEVAEPLKAEVVRFLAAAGAPADGVEVQVSRDGDRAHVVVTLPSGVTIDPEAVAPRVHARYREGRSLAQVVEISVQKTEPSGN